MPQISIGLAESNELLLERLSHEAMAIAQAGIVVSFQVRKMDGISLIDYELRDETAGEGGCLWREKLADVLADTVLDLFENSLAQDTLRRDHDYLSPEDLAHISQRLREELQQESRGDSQRRCRRKSMVATRFMENLDEFHDHLDLGGFVRFRLKEYQQEIRTMVSSMVDDYLMEKEHREFIQLLRYFVELQKPKTDWVQVLMTRDGFFRITDRDNRPIHAEYLDGVAGHHGGINYDDLLISALITIAPAYLVVHGRSFAKQETVDTICSVFEDRCTICPGCTLCETRADQP